ncbi:MAG: hypothetical protein AAFV69_03625 [Pseudomonadota bacterium]
MTWVASLFVQDTLPLLFFMLVLAAIGLEHSVPAPDAESETVEIVVPLFGVETIVERGNESDVIVRCSAGTATVVFNKYNAQFCTDDRTCFAALLPAARIACGS